MYMRKNRFFVALALLLAGLVPCSVQAQESSINTFTPYAMFGIGEINTPGSLPMRSMGGAGVAQRTPAAVNLLNPAAYSVTLPQSVLFNFGLEGQNYYNSQRKADGKLANTSYNTFNFHDIALQIPLTRGLGLGFSLTPYSSVGYRLYGRSEPVADVGTADYDYSGEGDVTEVKIGIGWEIFKNFSIGVAGQYYWGDITRNYTMTIYDYTGSTGSQGYPSTVGESNYSISRILGQVGVQYSPIADRRRVLTLGATYDFGGNLNPDVSETIIVNGTLPSTAKSEQESLALKLPAKLAVGAFYETPKVALALDYEFQNWGSRNSATEMAAGGFEVAYEDTNTVKFGVEWTPNRNDVRHFLKRWHYRAGVNYGNYHQRFAGEKLQQYAVTFGVGIPVKFGGFSAIDIGVEYGCRGSHEIIADNIGLIKQQYFKFAVAFSLFGEDYWFVRPKFD